MKKLIISGIPVLFPKEPYIQQIELMTKVICSLQKKENALLESPTGTGKTLALLCSSLAWQNSEYQLNNGPPRIFYATRTHKQMDQIIRELNTTDYKHTKISVLGSRNIMCINEAAKAEEDIGYACLRRKRVKICTGLCHFHKNLNEKRPDSIRQLISDEQNLFHEKLGQQTSAAQKSIAWNIGDFIKIGKKHEFCPYYATRKVLVEDADIVFCPYQYLIEPLIRRRMDLVSQNKQNIFIFDEAHNIEDACFAAGSFSISEDELSNEYSNLLEQRNNLKSIFKNYNTRHFDELLDVYRAILKFIKTYSDNDERWAPVHRDNRRILKKPPIYGEDIVNRLNEIKLNAESCNFYIRHMDVVIRDLSQFSFHQEKQSSGRVSFDSLEKILLFVEHLHDCNHRYINDFRFGLTKKMNSNSGNVTLLNAWCMNAAVVFRGIANKSWSILMTSGTLSPMDTFQSELGISFPIENRLEAPQTSSRDRVLIRNIGEGPNRKPLIFSYKHLIKEDKYKEVLDEFGKFLLDICRKTPAGVLCFLPSYRLLTMAVAHWRQNGGETSGDGKNVFAELNRIKKVVVEPQNPQLFRPAIRTYYEAAVKPDQFGAHCTGALFLAVYRGKISEGLDFSDDYARAVICAGIPYPDVSDLSIKLKMQYNDLNVSQGEKFLLPGFLWYSAQGYRALNQALGRCLRHSQDWGALILVDGRLASSSVLPRAKLSKWIMDRIHPSKDYQELSEELKKFYGKHTLSTSHRSILPHHVSSAQILQ